MDAWSEACQREARARCLELEACMVREGVELQYTRNAVPTERGNMNTRAGHLSEPEAHASESGFLAALMSAASASGDEGDGDDVLSWLHPEAELARLWASTQAAA